MEAVTAEKSIDKVYIQKGLKGSLVAELEAVIRKTGISARDWQKRQIESGF